MASHRSATALLPNIKHIVAVASGKGGVGKSTTAVNLAVAFATVLNWRSGLLDADIHGPSVPTLMNLKGRPAVSKGAHPLLMPLENYRVRCISMGFFTEGDSPVVWRGPIVNSAIEKFVKGTDWGDLDVLVIDMPPGTGDAQITLGQRLPLSGAVIVSTPQDLALLDARRGIQMFKRLNIPILGIIENMSYYSCKKCGNRENIFGHGGAATAAKDFGVSFLGEVPLDINIRVRSDEGAPVVVSEPQSPAAQAYINIALQVQRALVHKEAPIPPKIVVTD